MSWAPVSVATSMMTSGLSSPARTMASAMISRPSASVFITSTVLPPRMVSTSEGRIACPLGMFSAVGTQPTTLTSGWSRATAHKVAMTAAAPPMSDFIHSMAGGGLSEIPPESNVMPLPTRWTVARARLPAS